jgi:hypothetical protein
MRSAAGFPLWIGHVGDVRDPRSLFSTGTLAVIDLALNEPPASLPRELVYCRFPLIDGAGNPLHRRSHRRCSRLSGRGRLDLGCKFRVGGRGTGTLGRSQGDATFSCGSAPA